MSGQKNIMALTLDELVEKYKAGTMTHADLEESGYLKCEVEAKAEMDEHGNMKTSDSLTQLLYKRFLSKEELENMENRGKKERL